MNHPQATDRTEGVRTDPAELVFSLLNASRTLGGRMEDGLSSVGSSLAKHGVLTALVEADGPLALNELASRLQCVRSNVTQLVDRLEADGLVRRVDDAVDRRVVRAALTEEGRERQVAGAAEIDKVVTEFSAAFPASDRAVLARVLGALG